MAHLAYRGCRSVEPGSPLQCERVPVLLARSQILLVDGTQHGMGLIQLISCLLRIVLGCCELGLSHGAQQVIELGKVEGLICFQPLTQLNSLRDKHGETSSNSCDVIKYLVH